MARKDFSGATTSVAYYFSDHLKTTSVITNSAGVIIEDEDYYPWGGELQFVNSDSNHYKFTGKEGDSETGLDYFGARYYGNWLGRWMSPDWVAKPEAVPYSDLDDPQSLNLYSYVRNVPTSKADLDGHGCPPDCDIQVDMEAVRQTLQQLGPAAGPTLAAAGPVALLALPSAGAMYLVATHPPVENHPADDPPSAGNMMLDALNPPFVPAPPIQPQLGQGRGADEEKSQSDIAQERERTNGGIVKPGKGPGSVPKDQRDSKRSLTPAERQKLLDEQKGICPWCGRPTTVDKSATHHVRRHADGGRTKKPNLKAVCKKPCHHEIRK